MLEKFLLLHLCLNLAIVLIFESSEILQIIIKRLAKTVT